jgi:hypothetical protein
LKPASSNLGQTGVAAARLGAKASEITGDRRATVMNLTNNIQA